MGEFGAGLLGGILPLAGLLLAGWCTDKIAKRFLPRDNAAGCVVQMTIFIAIFAGLYFLFSPAVHVLKSYACRNAVSYSECLDPPPVEEWM